MRACPKSSLSDHFGKNASSSKRFVPSGNAYLSWYTCNFAREAEQKKNLVCVIIRQPYCLRLHSLERGKCESLRGRCSSTIGINNFRCLSRGTGTVLDPAVWNRKSVAFSTRFPRCHSRNHKGNTLQAGYHLSRLRYPARGD